MTDAGPNSKAVLRRISLGLGSQAYGQIVQVVIRLAEVPLLLHFWGAVRYGEWLMLAAIPAYLSISDGGFSGAATRDMSIRSGAGDQAGSLSVFQSTAILLAAVSVTVLIVVVTIVAIAPLSEWLGFNQIGSTETKVIVVLLVGQVLMSFQTGLLYGGFWCSGKYSIGMGFLSTTQLLEFGALALTVFFGGGPIQAAEAYLGGRMLGTVATRLALKRATPWLRYGLDKVSMAEIRRLTLPAFASLAFPLGNALNIQVMRLVIGVVVGPTAVATFTPLRTLSNLATQPRGIINRLIEPELSMAFGRGDQALFRRLFLRSCQATLWFCLVASMGLVLIGGWVWPIWTGGKLAMLWPVFMTLISGVVVNSLWYTALMVPYATNRHGRIAAVYSVIYGIGALVFGYLGVKTAGLFGAAVALLTAEIFMMLYVVPASLMLTGETLGQWLSTTFRPPIFMFLMTLHHASNGAPRKNAR